MQEILSNPVVEGPNALYGKSRERIQQYKCDSECKKELQENFSESSIDMMFILSLVIISIVIQLFIGKYIWNNVIHKLIPGTKKMNSIAQMLAIIIFVQMIGYCCY
jgi:hypothetical protein